MKLSIGRVEIGHGKPGSHGKVMEIDLVWKSHGDLQKNPGKPGKVMEICLTLDIRVLKSPYFAAYLTYESCKI